MKKNSKTSQVKKFVDYDFDTNYSKYYWLIIPLLTIVYFIYSHFSNGFYQDDEVMHYLQMRDFWTNPWIFMSNPGKPGWKIFMVIPALLGYKPVLFVNSFFTALTSYFCIKLAQSLKMKNSIMAGVFFAFQPLVLQVSFRSYAEIFTGLTLVLALYFYFKNNYILSGLFCGLAFTARQETALLGVVLAVYFIIQKKYLAVIFLGVFPFLMNFLGFIHTGDYIWVWDEMRSIGEFQSGIERSAFHYFEMYIFIVGPIVFSCFIIGLVSLYYSRKELKDFYKKEFLIYLFFFIQFLFQSYLILRGLNPGTWRYILQTAPFSSIIALIGFNQIIQMKIKKYILPVLGLVILITLLFLSKESTGLFMEDKPEYFKLFALIIFTGGTFLLVKWNNTGNYFQYIIFTSLLAIVFLFYTEKPKQQSPENAALEKAAGIYESSYKNAPEVLYDHNLILFYGNISGAEKSKFKILNMNSLKQAPKGTLVMWDSHYSYNPKYTFEPPYKNDVNIDSLINNKEYKQLNQLVSTDRTFEICIFEKL